MKRTKVLLLIIPILLLLTSCSVNPVTGKTQYNIVSTEEEYKIGKQADPYIRLQYGVYPDKALQSYVTKVGDRVAKVSDRPGIAYSFTILDSPMVNAFALPGGFLYITRGTLAQMNSEAELAFVLGHEISHVAAKHGAQRLSQQRSIGFANLLAKLITQKDDLGLAGNVANLGVNMAVLGYGRENEFEADIIGLKYAHDANYDTVQGSRFLNTLQKQAKHEPGWVENFFISHPPTTERIARADEENEALLIDAPPQKEIGRKTFLSHIEGIFMGNGLSQGRVEEGRYFNDHYNFTFIPPKGWDLSGSKEPGELILLKSPHKDAYAKGTLFLFKPAKAKSLGEFVLEAEAHIFTDDTLDQLSQEQKVINRVKIMQKRYEGRSHRVGAGQFWVLYTLQKEVGVALVFSQNNIASKDETSQVMATLNSFRPMTKEEIKTTKMYRLEVHKVKAGETLTSLAEKYLPDDEEGLAKLRDFNDFPEDKKISPGDWVKIPPTF